MNWRPWVTRTSATTPKESRIGSMPACRSRASITILGDSARTETNYVAPAALTFSESSTNIDFMTTL